MLECATSGAARALSGKEQRTGNAASTRIGRVGIERGIPVLRFRSSKLVVEAQAERQSQAARGLVLVVNPRRRVGFVEHRVEWNGLRGGIHLTQQERSEGLASVGDKDCPLAS